jgi:hypothetical protein
MCGWHGDHSDDFRRALCNFGDMTPHTLIDGAQTTLTARPSGRADRRNDPREAWRPKGDTEPRPPEAFDRCTGVTRAVRDDPQHEATLITPGPTVYMGTPATMKGE